ncbi:hypothetical protein N7456_003447 [Penicillium angulare]|uniref:Uncharacterized protein n=1 Tax=Penicillium angulare TaxID=116970 RepID=A0A9W9KIR3_9EURO|nr:hypothetical protein N7456_003447 [Penicillium angulare]
MDIGTEWDGQSTSMPPDFGKELYKFWQETFAVSPKKACEWRGLVTELMNISSSSDSSVPEEDRILNYRDTTPGIRSFNIRESYFNQLVINMMSESSLIWPMRGSLPPEEELSERSRFARAGELRRIYKGASGFAVLVWARGNVKSFDEDIHGIGPYRQPLDGENRRWEPTGYSEYCKSDGWSYYNGLKAVLILWPTTWTSSWKPGRGLAEEHRDLAANGDWMVWDEEKIWKHTVTLPGDVVIGMESFE